MGRENYPWAFSNSRSEVHFSSHPHRRQRDPRPAPSRASKRLPWFYSRTAWLLHGQTRHLLVSLGICHPHGAKAAPQTSTAPESSAGNNPGGFSSVLLKAGKRRVRQGCAGILPWERCWVPMEGSGMVDLISEVLGKRAGEAREAGASLGSGKRFPPGACAEVKRSPGSPVLLLCVTWMSHVQPRRPLPRNIHPPPGLFHGEGGRCCPAQRAHGCGCVPQGWQQSSSTASASLWMPGWRHREGSAPTASLRGHARRSQAVLIHPGS